VAPTVPDGEGHVRDAAPDDAGPESGPRFQLFVVTGANGTGKSSLCPHLRELLPDCVVFEGDVIPITWSLDEWSERKAEYRNTCLSVALEIARNDLPVIFVSTADPDEFEASPIRSQFHHIHYLALVCDEEVIEQRLRSRPVPHTPVAKDFDRYLNTQLWVDRSYRAAAGADPSLTVVDVSALLPQRTAEQVAIWVRERVTGTAGARSVTSQPA
jgi:broad-specificity NMP kinase